MRSLVLAGLFAASLGGEVEASSGTKIWEVTGFDAPESVVLDPGSTAIYVSNVAGSVMATDGNGFISKVSPDGKMIERNWVTGLNGPTGLAISDGKLYVADIDELVEIDILGAKIRKRYPAVGARFLNDVASDGAGAVYTSDMMTDTIWRLKDGKFAAWLKSPDLNGPNGLLVDGDKLVVAAFGRLSGNDKVAEAGTLLFVSLADKSIKPLRGGAIGNLDGLLMLAPGRYVATDWPKGALYLITSDGKSEEIIDLNQGTADIALGADKNTVLIPMMKDNAVVAYRIE